MLHGVITMDQAIANGTSRSKVYRLVTAGTWIRLHEGVFLTEPNRTGRNLWLAEVSGHIIRGGKGSMASHRAAAMLHSLEGVSGFPIEVTVPANSTHKAMHRSQRPEPNPQLVEGIPTTSLVRTLLDLGQVCPSNVLEQAVESALRGNDPRRPDIWNVRILSELRLASATDQYRRVGNFTVRRVLERRSDEDRPTGSYPETLLFQALRDIGVSAVRQPTLHISDPNGLHLDTLFPDLAIPHLQTIFEVDGSAAHSTPGALERDLLRQNKLVRAFNVFRFPASHILQDPAALAAVIARSIADLPINETHPLSWSSKGMAVRYEKDTFFAVDKTRSASTRNPSIPPMASQSHKFATVPNGNANLTR
jgi:hypothetical protein